MRVKFFFERESIWLWTTVHEDGQGHGIMWYFEFYVLVKIFSELKMIESFENFQQLMEETKIYMIIMVELPQFLMNSRI